MINNKIIIISLTILNLFNFGYSQDRIHDTEYLKHSVHTEKDTIDFIISQHDFKTKKPVLLFCQGSQPVPLIIEIHGSKPYVSSLSNFDVQEIKKHYHVVVISMPKTPLIESIDNLNNSFCYVTDKSIRNSYSIDYVKANYIENYVNRANAVWDYLKNQKWVDNTKFVLAGHSQGSRIAVEIASTNDDVSHLGLFGYNPQGRIDQMIWNARNRAMSGDITWEKADTIQQYYYDLYRASFDDEFLEEKPELIAWRTFSKNSINELLKLTIPIYIAYGSEDEIANNADLLPLRFIEEGKTNYQIHRYANLEHNFFPVIEGKVDHKNGKWVEVMSSFIASTINY